MVVALLLAGLAVYAALGTAEGANVTESAIPGVKQPIVKEPVEPPSVGAAIKMDGATDDAWEFIAGRDPSPSLAVLGETYNYGRQVALTFDDGPGEWTDDALAVLAQEDVKATFFVIGREAAAAPELVRQIVAAGHAVENHSWSHPYAGRSGHWNSRLIGKEIRRTSAEISHITGQPPCFFRPPQGVVPGSERPARAAGLTMTLWSVDTRDWAMHGSKAAATIRARARTGLQEPNPIVLLHDGGGNRRATLAALPGIIEDYRSAGYAFVTLGDGRD